MGNITIESPVSLEKESTRPLLLSNTDYPFISIDHRRFEKLCYWVYRCELESGEWIGRFDEIRLMSGVRDGGKDCALYNAGLLTAIIQCKHSEDDKSLSPPIFVKEVIKFGLYCQLESIVSDVTKFTYFIASSSGFTEDCSDLIRDFGKETTSHKTFEQWTNSIIKSNSALGDLIYTDIETSLKSFLNNINIIKIDKEELNRILNKPYQIETLKAFFELKSVVDQSLIFPLQAELQKISKSLENKSSTSISAEKAEEIFEDASLFLKSWVSHINNLHKIHIDRQEVVNVIEWIKSPLKETEKPIAIISGDSGSGKTVILKDVYEKLINESIPVLGIKCDRYYSLDIVGLERAMAFPTSFQEMIDVLLSKHSLVVILVDQIDALSQALSSNRKFLDTYLLLIQKLSRTANVRVVISARKFDLTYDPNLAGLKSNKNFEVGLLSEDKVKSILGTLNINTERISNRLLQTLRIPNNLQVFSNIYNPTLSLEGIAELQDLYNELWIQRVINGRLNPDDPKTYVSCIYKLAGEMNLLQQIVVDRSKFENEYNTEINYFLSSGILVQTGKAIQFFHQSFYDFAYARHFAENGNDLYHYILANLQTLHIRSSIKMILSYLRTANEKIYINSLNQILRSSSIHFHIKLLVINNLGYVTSPIDSELKVVKARVINSQRLRIPFLESLFGNSWITFLIEQGVLDKLVDERKELLDKIYQIKSPYRDLFLKIGKTYFQYQDYETRRINSINQFYSILARSLPESRKTVAGYLLRLTHFEALDWIVTRVLYSVKIWDCKELYSLLEKYHYAIQKDIFSYCHILEDMINYDIDIVVIKFKTLILGIVREYEDRHNRSLHDHQLIELFKKIIQANEEKAFNVGVEILRNLSSKSKRESNLDDEDLYDDLTFFMFDYDKEYKQHDRGIYSEVIEIAEQLSIMEDQKFKLFIKDSIGDNSIAILRILVYAFYANPNPYKEQICEFIETFANKSGFEREGKIQYWIRKLIGKAYTSLNQSQKSKVNDVILSLDSSYELKTTLEEGKKTHHLKYYGYKKYTYLKAISEDQILAQIELRRTYQELKRKFGIISDIEPNIFHSYRVGPPLEINAYEKMTFSQWEESFEKYRPNTSSSFGSSLEHSRAFSDIVKKQPERFFPFIEKIVKENTIAIEYLVKALEGLKEANYEPAKVLPVYKMVIAHKQDREHSLYLIWLVDFFIHSRLVDDVVVDFLASQVSSHPDPDRVKHNNGPLMDGVNSVRGAAIDRLLLCTYNPIFSEKIFLAAEVACEDKIVSVRAALLRHLAYLIRFDKQRSIDIFLKAVETDDPNLIKVSIHSLQYFVHHGFEKLLPHLEKWISYPLVQEDLGGVLTWCWINNYVGSKPLMNKVFKLSSEARAIAVRISYENLFDKEEFVRIKCQLLFYRFLNDNSKDVNSQYNLMFLHLEEKSTFSNWIPYLRKYVKSKSAKSDPNYFLKYLLTNSGEYPVECINLLADLKSLPRPDISNGPYYEDEPIKIILNCYNVLNNSGDKKNLRKSIRLFDRMLETDFLRQQANKALHLVER